MDEIISPEEELDMIRKKEKKALKKLEKKERKREIREIQALIQTLKTLFDRMEQIDDMHLRCYMMLDRFTLLMDLSTALLGLSDYSKKVKNGFHRDLKTITNQINASMVWLMNERRVDPAEAVNGPLAENQQVLDLQ